MLLIRSQSGRGGFGTTLGLVLTIVGLVLMIILGVDTLGRGSRLTIERALGLAQATRIGHEAINEISMVEENRKELLKLIEQRLALLNPSYGASIPQEERMRTFLVAMKPDGPYNLRYGVNPRDGKLAEGLFLMEGKPNTVGFAGGTYAEVKARTVERIHDPEIKGGTLELSKVKVRPVMYTFSSEGAGGQGEGIARASVTVSVRLGKGKYSRRITVDRKFAIKEEKGKWDVFVETDPWSMEACDLGAVDE